MVKSYQKAAALLLALALIFAFPVTASAAETIALAFRAACGIIKEKPQEEHPYDRSRL